MRALVSWVLFDWAAQPYYTLVLTFLFAPYFANAVVGDPAHGQALWGYAAAAAGVLIAIGSPLLGALADGRGARKPWIALFSLLFVASLSALWLAVPGASMPVIALVLHRVRRGDGGGRVHDRVHQRDHAEPRAGEPARTPLGHRLGGRLRRAASSASRSWPGSSSPIRRRARRCSGSIPCSRSTRRRAKATASSGRSRPLGTWSS